MGKATDPRPRTKKTGPSKIASIAPGTDQGLRAIAPARLADLFDEALQDSRLRAGDLVSVSITASNGSRFHLTTASAVLKG